MRLEIRRKAFLAKLPIEMSDHHVAVLKRWADEYCSSHRLMKTPRYVGLYCLRDRPRTSQAWQRHLRQILTKLGLPLPKPGTRWLELVETAMFHDVEQEHFPCQATSAHRVDASFSKSNASETTSKDGDKVFTFLPQSCAAHRDVPAASEAPTAFSNGMKSRLQVVKLD